MVSETTSVSITKTRVVTSTQRLPNGFEIAASQVPVQGLVDSSDSNVPWSPSAACGLSTPPPTPVTSCAKIEIPNTNPVQATGHQGMLLNLSMVWSLNSSHPTRHMAVACYIISPATQTVQTPQRMTPHTRVPDSPLPAPVSDSVPERVSNRVISVLLYSTLTVC